MKTTFKDYNKKALDELLVELAAGSDEEQAAGRMMNTLFQPCMEALLNEASITSIKTAIDTFSNVYLNVLVNYVVATNNKPEDVSELVQLQCLLISQGLENIMPKIIEDKQRQQSEPMN